LEVKLTALPDQTTFDKSDDMYGSEIVVRPDTIVYLACSIIESFELAGIDFPDFKRIDLSKIDEPKRAIELSPEITKTLKLISSLLSGVETPILVQPIWKTKRKSPILDDNCLDLFAWSNIGLCRFIHDISQSVLKNGKMTRQYRTAVWLFKMIYDFFNLGASEYELIIDKLSYNLKNDKAFSSTGAINNMFMSCDNLIKPRVKKQEIKNIILNGGQNFLSPERRFDAIICNSPDIFES
jgi:type II restriction enzyme